MCGGYWIASQKIREKELLRFFSKEQVKTLLDKGFFEGHFWDRRPILPVEKEDKISLIDWGNRDKKAPFPLTGWAKKESIEKGNWQWLQPQLVKIPIEKGFEKGVWFNMPQGTEGLLVEKEGDRRVYMITEAASLDYIKQTNHNRMPTGPKEKFQPPSNLAT